MPAGIIYTNYTCIELIDMTLITYNGHLQSIISWVNSVNTSHLNWITLKQAGNQPILFRDPFLIVAAQYRLLYTALQKAWWLAHTAIGRLRAAFLP